LPAAIRQKLVQEIAMNPINADPVLTFVEDQAIDCMIGEKMGPYVPRFRPQGSFQ
jgi:hypothetical protein